MPSGEEEEEPGAFEDTELDDFCVRQLGAGLFSDKLLHRGEGGKILITGSVLVTRASIADGAHRGQRLAAQVGTGPWQVQQSHKAQPHVVWLPLLSSLLPPKPPTNRRMGSISRHLWALGFPGHSQGPERWVSVLLLTQALPGKLPNAPASISPVGNLPSSVPASGDSRLPCLPSPVRVLCL